MVHILDTHQLGRPGIIAATALETADGIALFDTGPESTFPTVVNQLRNVGARVEDVRHVFLSHIHFDHAGAAWRFAESGATVYVHPIGAPHLIEPAKLIESATRIFGDEMGRLWGKIAPVPRERVRILEDNDVVQIGALEIRAVETPGHASHHHIYHWDDNVFGGDIAGVRIGGGPGVPPFVPPELHVESWLGSIDKIRALDPARLYLPHFGLVEMPILSHLAEVEERVRRWSAWFRDRMSEGDQDEQLIPAFAQYEADDLQAAGASKSDVSDYETADPSYMAVTAAQRYWRKYHPAEISQGK